MTCLYMWSYPLCLQLDEKNSVLKQLRVKASLEKVSLSVDGGCYVCACV